NLPIRAMGQTCPLWTPSRFGNDWTGPGSLDAVHTSHSGGYQVRDLAFWSVSPNLSGVASAAPGVGRCDATHYAASRSAHRGADARKSGRVEGFGVTLSIMTSTLAGDVVEVSPSGEIDVENAYEIREVVAAQLADRRPARIELNMQNVTFIDSVGIS